jgi:hypothetical protein
MAERPSINCLIAPLNQPYSLWWEYMVSGVALLPAASSTNLQRTIKLRFDSLAGISEWMNVSKWIILVYRSIVHFQTLARPFEVI